MIEAELVLSHDQLVSAAISLMDSEGRFTSQLFGDTGYRLRMLEITLVSSKNQNYSADILAQCDERNVSLVIECKTHDSSISDTQLRGYLSTTGEDIVRKGIPVPSPKDHQSQSMFLVLPTVTATLVEGIRRNAKYSPTGWGIVELSPEELVCAHSEFEDEPLDNIFRTPRPINFETVSLERLPFSPSCPDYVLVDSIFSTLISFLIGGTEEFSVEDLCATANPLFALMADQQDLIRKRVRRHMIAIRKNALPRWIKNVASGGTTEDRWKFAARSSVSSQTIQAFSTRHRVYVQYLRDTGELPKRLCWITEMSS